MEIRRHKRNVYRLGASEDGVGSIVFIEWGENGHLITRVDDGHHNRHHSFCASAGDCDFAVRVIGNAGKMLLLSGQSFAEILSAPGNGILMRSRMGNLGKTVGDFYRWGKIRKSLGKIDSAILTGYPGHTANYGI